VATILPPSLRAGSRVALVAPAGPLAPEAVERAVARVRRHGWVPLLGAHAGGRHWFLSGTDEERLADLQRALDDPETDAVWFLRGGYGTMRLLQRIGWDALAERPRALIGFSDNTALHLAARGTGVVTFHGPHPGAELPAFAEDGLLRVVARSVPAGVLPFPDDGPERAETVADGVAEGPLVGGNLALIAATLGTPYAVRAEGALLFLEEVGEAVYRIDRLLTQLHLAGTARPHRGAPRAARRARRTGPRRPPLRTRRGELDAPPRRPRQARRGRGDAHAARVRPRVGP
jgi:muramoyltetrapeptide carboxypeptidase